MDNSYVSQPLARWTLIGLTLIVLALPAWAQTKGESEAQCGVNTDPDTRISGCTALIQSGQQTTENLAISYNNRGIGYNRKGLYDQAIADATEAITLKPDHPKFYYWRATAKKAKGDSGGAKADYAKALELKPDFVDAQNALAALNK